MSAEIVTSAAEALPSLEKARSLLEGCRKTHECQKIKALAQAVAYCATSVQARDEASAIVLLAKARIGELTAEVKALPPTERRTSLPAETKSTRTDRLAAEGLSRKDAGECEKIAALKKSGDLQRLVDVGCTSTADALRLQRIAPDMRERVFAKLAEQRGVRLSEVAAAAQPEAAKVKRPKVHRAPPTVLSSVAKDAGLTAEQWAELRPAIKALLDAVERACPGDISTSKGDTAKEWRDVYGMLQALPSVQRVEAVSAAGGPKS
jgi:hypothetical protein